MPKKYFIFWLQVRSFFHCCRKQYIQLHKEKYVYDIAQKDDKEFDQSIVARFQNISYSAFNQRYIEYLGEFCGKIDLSCQKVSSEALRTF